MSVSLLQLLTQLVSSSTAKSSEASGEGSQSATPAPKDYQYLAASANKKSDLPSLAAFVPNDNADVVTAPAPAPASKMLNVASSAYPHNQMANASKYSSLVAQTADRINVIIAPEDLDNFRDYVQGATGKRLTDSQLIRFVKERTASSMVKMVGGNPTKLEEFFKRDNGSADGLTVEISDKKTTDNKVVEGKYAGSSSAGYCTHNGELCFSTRHFTDDDVLIHELSHGYDNSDSGFWRSTGEKEIHGLTEADEGKIENAYDRLKNNPTQQKKFFENWGGKDYAMTNRIEFFAELWTMWNTPIGRKNIEKHLPELVPVFQKLSDEGHVHDDHDDHDHDHELDKPKGDNATGGSPTEDLSKTNSGNLSGNLSATTAKRQELKSVVKQLQSLAKHKQASGSIRSDLSDLLLDISLLNMKNTSRLTAIIGRIQSVEAKIKALPEPTAGETKKTGTGKQSTDKSQESGSGQGTAITQLDVSGLKGKATGGTFTVGPADTYEKMAKNLVKNNAKLASSVSSQASAQGLSVEDYIAKKLKQYNTEQHPKNRDQWPWVGDVIDINQALGLAA